MLCALLSQVVSVLYAALISVALRLVVCYPIQVIISIPERTLHCALYSYSYHVFFIHRFLLGRLIVYCMTYVLEIALSTSQTSTVFCLFYQ